MVVWASTVHETEFKECYQEECMAYDKTIFPPCHRMRGHRDGFSLSPKRKQNLVEDADDNSK